MNVDTLLGERATLRERLLRRLGLRYVLRDLPRDPDRGLPLSLTPCDRLAGQVLIGPGAADAPAPALDGAALVVGTLRMGYGHHRIARSVSTWAIRRGATPYLNDLLALPGPESEAIARLDRSYSRFSRWASNAGGVVDRVWGALMSGGGMEPLRFSCALAEALTPLMRGLPRDVPVVCAHPLNAQIAVACGFERVINLVIDNHPQPFVVAPGALNLVQSPAYAYALRAMGLPREQVEVAGHWVPADLLDGLTEDCGARLDRRAAGAPLRLLLPIGGAGGQRRFVCDLIRALAPAIRGKRLQLWLNAGDHRDVRDALLEVAVEQGFQRAALDGWDDLIGFCAHADADEVTAPLTVFGFDRHDHAFAATDHLARRADLLVTKPSELAFYPVPKLHIRRIGGHEAASALRSAELGDGTPECRTVAAAAALVEELLEDRRILAGMNRRIYGHALTGVYDGSRRAVELALGSATPSRPHPQGATRSAP